MVQGAYGKSVELEFIDSLFIEKPGFIYVGNTEYSGNILYKDSKLNKVLFPGGYCTFI